MLSTPKSGWTNFSLPGTDEYSLSYLNDIGIEWIEDAIAGLEKQRPFCVTGSMEPELVVCIVNYHCCHVLIYEDECSHENEGDVLRMEFSPIGMLEFCKILYNDINNAVDVWANFADYTGNYSDKRRKLEEYLEQLQALIKIKEDAH